MIMFEALRLSREILYMSINDAKLINGRHGTHAFTQVKLPQKN